MKLAEQAMQFKGKVAVVTGGSKGIGGATSEAFLAEGAKVAVLDIEPPTFNQGGERLLFVKTDVSRSDQVKAAFYKIIKQFGGVDVLVNNAGIQRYGTVVDNTEAQWDEVIGVNLKSHYLCAHHAIPSMLQRGKGVVINVASVQAFVSQPKAAAYVTSKCGVLGLTRAIAIDFAPHVRCVAVCPGTVDTPMLQWAVNQSPDPQAVLAECDAMHLTGRIGKPQEIADLILFLASDKAGFITGVPIRIDGGLGQPIGGSIRK
jgi:NAD(P)-dependent dehydrogenase (short-subunit alcohol dehydrogenase family)